MKQLYTYMITSFCLTILLLSAFTLYKAHECIVDANSFFENFIEVYQASYYRDDVVDYFNESDYEFIVTTQNEKKVIVMSYEIKIFNEVVYKQIKAELLMK